MKTETRGNEGCVALMLDVIKAYACMYYDFLKQVVIKMSFKDKLIHWMSMNVDA